jgi:hypothetical protein
VRGRERWQGRITRREGAWHGWGTSVYCCQGAPGPRVVVREAEQAEARAASGLCWSRPRASTRGPARSVSGPGTQRLPRNRTSRHSRWDATLRRMNVTETGLVEMVRARAPGRAGPAGGEGGRRRVPHSISKTLPPGPQVRTDTTDLPHLGGLKCISAATVGRRTVLVLEVGTVRGFGTNYYGGTDVPDLGGLRDVTAGSGSCTDFGSGADPAGEAPGERSRGWRLWRGCAATVHVLWTETRTAHPAYSATAVAA